MKKILNNNTLFGLIIGIIIMSGIGVLAIDYLYNANQVSYKKADNTEVDVKTALDELYDKTKNKRSNVSLDMSSMLGSDYVSTRTFTAEPNTTYLINVATSKSKYNCSDSTSSVSITGSDNIDVLYNQSYSYAWSASGGNQLHLYVAKLTVISSSTITITANIGNGYPLGYITVVKIQ